MVCRFLTALRHAVDQGDKTVFSKATAQEIASKKAVMGALRLYLDFVNLFMLLIQFMGVRQ